MCNQFALDYHFDINGKFHYPDYRLIDLPQIIKNNNNSNKSPLFAAGLSMILPGSGRIYKLTGAFAMANQIIGRARRSGMPERVSDNFTVKI